MAQRNAAWVADAIFGGACAVVANVLLEDVVTFPSEITAATGLPGDVVACALVVLERHRLLVRDGPAFRAAVIEPGHAEAFQSWLETCPEPPAGPSAASA